MVAIASLSTTVASPGRARRAVPPAHRPGPGAGRPRLTLVPGGPPAARTVGGRSVASVVATLLLAVAVLLAAGYLVRTPTAAPGAASAGTTHVAAEGDTMWSIAVEHAPAGEAATYVERLVAANGGSTVAPGQVLTLPAP